MSYELTGKEKISMMPCLLLIYSQVTCEIKIRNISDDIVMKSFEEHLKRYLFRKKGTLVNIYNFNKKKLKFIFSPPNFFLAPPLSSSIPYVVLFAH